MIKEFAVEPEAIVSSYREFSYVIEKFGICEGRVISEFPKKWRRMVYEAAIARHRGTTEQSKIEERLRRLPPGVLINLARPSGDGQEGWLARALQEHERLPFDYILASRTVEHAVIVPIEQFDGEHSCLQITREMSIQREPNLMADACDFLLRTAQHVKLVDPHFDFSHDRFVQPFCAFVQRLKPGTLVEIYRDSEVASAELARRANRLLPACLPAGVTVRLIVWTAEPMHNRFLMTNLGGVRFGVGLDAAGPDSAQEDEVSLMVPAVWQSRWALYSGGESVGEWQAP